ncbi:hypothetical protein [Bacillus sp. B1-b2]|uniref:hypothetical protein n=1 Tax=Bacillus sp. B1-b2 TaxID=2653201 RepID=UPI00126256A3|nr:hypothetical protein [Bacillus sp. B1-b2]KAB7672081.1 hypothetical protein F9279_03960 [Bacillus sp. B1-b2]
METFIYTIIGILAIWLILGMIAEWIIVHLFDIQPKSKFGKSLLYFINLPGNLFIYLITALSTLIIIPIFWVIARLFGKSKKN